MKHFTALVRSVSLDLYLLSYCFQHCLSGKENERKGTAGAAEVLKWILDSAHEKIMEFLETLMKFFNMLIHPNCDEEKPDMYSDAVKVSFRLTVFVFIVVAIARIK
jgi:aromatic ring-cleaving dioxygenase